MSIIKSINDATCMITRNYIIVALFIVSVASFRIADTDNKNIDR